MVLWTAVVAATRIARRRHPCGEAIRAERQPERSYADILRSWISAAARCFASHGTQIAKIDFIQHFQVSRRMTCGL